MLRHDDQRNTQFAEIIAKSRRIVMAFEVKFELTESDLEHFP